MFAIINLFMIMTFDSFMFLSKYSVYWWAPFFFPCFSSWLMFYIFFIAQSLNMEPLPFSSLSLATWASLKGYAEKIFIKLALGLNSKRLLLSIFGSLLSWLAQMALPWAYIGEWEVSKTLESSTLVEECGRFWRDLEMSTHLYTMVEDKGGVWSYLQSSRGLL